MGSYQLGPVHTIHYTVGKASILIPFLTDFFTVMETIVQEGQNVHSEINWNNLIIIL